MNVKGAARLHHCADLEQSLELKVVQQAASIKGWLSEQAARVEAEKRIPQDVADRLVEADLFRITQPRRFGGLSLPPHAAWAAVFEVARGCSSCAWIVGLTVANILLVGRMSEDAQRDVFGGSKPAIVSLLTGGVAQGVTAERVEGGVRLSGRWRYASGIDVATWVGLLVSLPLGAGGALEPYIVVVPKEEFTVDQGAWNVLGMRGTGSKDIALEPTFVPEHRWMNWAALQAGEKHPTCPNDEHIYRYPLNPTLAMSILAPTLGVASAVGDEFRDLVRKRYSSAIQQHQLDDKVSQIDVATGQATMAMLRRSLVDEAAQVLTKVESGHDLSLEERAELRMKLATSSRIALSAAQHMFGAIGGSLLPTGTRIERLFRDLHAMSSHFLLQPNIIGEAYGRLLLGLNLPASARL